LTPANLELLQQNDLLPSDIKAAPEDLLIVVRAGNVEDAAQALSQVDALLARRRAAVDAEFRPHGLESAAKMLPEATWVLVSVPGRYAAQVASQALELDRHVFLYSDNVSLADEVRLKQDAAEKGLIVMGPDCGTAMVNGVGLGFANRVRRGRIGLVGASGTGLQAVTARIHQLGGGVSHALGTGGRDLKTEVGGRTTLQCLDLLSRDPDTGEVLDYVGGQADLAARVIRAIGDPAERFHEDRLRMLRAVRLAARLNYAIEPVTFAAIKRLAAEIEGIAWERIGEEIVRVLTEGAARRGFELLDQLGLLQQVLPEISALKGVEQSPDYHPEGDVFRHTLLLLEQLDQIDQPAETLALGALLHDVAKPQCAGRDGERITFYGHAEVGAELAVAICQRLRRSREVSERVRYLVRGHLRLMHASEMRLSTLRRFLAEEGIEELLELARIDALASHRDLRCYQFCRAKREEFGAQQLKPPPLVRGRDLLAIGYPRGPLYAEILREVETKQLDGELTSLEEALAWVERNYPKS